MGWKALHGVYRRPNPPKRVALGELPSDPCLTAGSFGLQAARFAFRGGLARNPAESGRFGDCGAWPAALSLRDRFRANRSGHRVSRDQCVEILSNSRSLGLTPSAGKQNGPDAPPSFRKSLPRRLGVFSRCNEVPQQPASRWNTDPSPRSPGPSGTRVSAVPACLDRSGNALQSLGQI